MLITKDILDANFPDVYAHEVRDVFSESRKYLVLDAVQSHIQDPMLRDLLIQCFGRAPIIAKFGDDSVIKIRNDYLLIMRGIDPDEVRKNFFDDHKEYTHRLAIRTAEYHTYVDFVDKETGAEDCYGTSITSPGSLFGSIYVRKDDYYNERYFKGHISIEPGILSPVIDQGSLSLEFDITAAQHKKGIKYVNQTAEHYRNSWLKPFYFLLPVPFLTKNCVSFAKEVFHECGFLGDFYSYAKIDETDLHDKGTFFLFYDNQGLKETLWDNFALAKSTMLGDVSINVAHSNTELHFAILRRQLDKAIEIVNVGGDDLNARNMRQETPMILAAGLPYSEEKKALMEALVAYGADVNLSDYHNINSALTKAIMAKDAWAVQFLIEHGADARFINSNNDSLFDIAAAFNSFQMLTYLYAVAPDLIYRENKEHHSPAYYAYIADGFDIGSLEGIDYSLIGPYEGYMHPL